MKINVSIQCSVNKELMAIHKVYVEVAIQMNTLILKIFVSNVELIALSVILVRYVKCNSFKIKLIIHL